MKVFFMVVALAATPTWAQSGQSSNRPGANAMTVPESILRMRVVLREVLAKLEEARKSKDVVKLNCVNEKLMQIKGLIRISEQADSRIQEALSNRDKNGADQEEAKVGIAKSKVEQLRAEAEQCIGELAYRADESLLVEVDIPDDLPLLDPTRPSAPGDITSRTPPVQNAAPDPITEQPPASPTL